jgi:oligopeptide/dipeptide ABC transporter ATP-binding protein
VEPAEALLSVRQLSTRFVAAERAALDEVTFDVARGSIVGLVGDSGSGKSLTALSILSLLPEGATVAGGQVLFQGRDLLQASPAELGQIRGRGIGMIFQEPASALSAVHSVGWQLALALRAGGQLQPVGLLKSLSRAGRARARELLAHVELPDPDALLDLYPHQLSAGMRRRVMIALALASQPSLLIADEPTTGLDAPIQAQILDLFTRLAQSEGRGVLFITHDLCVAAEIASEIVVLYAGQVVEAGPTRSVLGRPQHPYTLSLLANIPGHGSGHWQGSAAPGQALPALARPGSAGRACAFLGRCPQHAGNPERFVRCGDERPLLEPAGARHRSRCFYPRLDGEREPTH